ncbi:MAG: hypothetical protein M1823_003379 [Watsoniomyces obsoletus]|nr:MAG: hypothetical protein M1823_003379 [Watsoniomyces obsoletus]
MPDGSPDQDVGEANEDAFGASLVNIAEQGDLILNTDHKRPSEPSLFRVDSTCLKESSPYFRALLGTNFKEGASVRESHERLIYQGRTPAEARASQLPQIHLSDFGQESQPTDLSNFVGDFLRIIHGLDITPTKPGIRYFACLATLADRYNCLAAVSQYVERKRYLHSLNGRTKGRTSGEISEEHLRQKILVGWLLNYPPWVMSYSQRLIIRGSVRWAGGGTDTDASVDDAEQCLWWDLPDGIEVELQTRRERILETINSLQMDLVGRYMSRRQQCTLGYASSPQCDSFQLGEAIRFLSRVGTIKVQGLLYDTHMGEPNARSIFEIISTLRQCPSYQIDQHHAHCGIRSRLVPALQFIQFVLEYGVGLCRDCWENNRLESRWSEIPLEGRWVMPGDYAEWLSSRRPSSCKEFDAKIKALFTAATREWP